MITKGNLNKNTHTMAHRHDPVTTDEKIRITNRSARSFLVPALLLSSFAWLGACAQVPIQPQNPPALSGTWIAKEQAFVFCPGGTLFVTDPALKVNWCQGTYSADGRFSVNCAATSPGGAHTSTGRCTLSGNALTCPYTANARGYTFSGTQGSGGVCKA